MNTPNTPNTPFTTESSTPPARPGSVPASPARAVTVSQGSRTLMRTLVAVVGVLALLLPVSALAFTGTSLVRLVHQETVHELPADATTLAVDVQTATVSVSVSDAFDVPTARHVYEGPDVDVQDPQVTAANGTATVTMANSSDRTRWWGPNLGMDEKLYIELPTDYAAKLNLDVTSQFGFTEIMGDFAQVTAESETGAFDLDVTAGDVVAKNRAGVIDVSGAMETLTLATSTGYIETSRVDVSKALSAKANTGAINLGLGENAVPRDGIEAHARNGSVNIGLPREAKVQTMDVTGYSVIASAGTGAVSVDVRQSNPGEGVIPVNASAASGEVHVFYQDDMWTSDNPDVVDEDDAAEVDDPWDENWDQDGDQSSGQNSDQG